MIIEKGQATMVASDSMASLATIESPEWTTREGTTYKCGDQLSAVAPA